MEDDIKSAFSRRLFGYLMTFCQNETKRQFLSVSRHSKRIVDFTPRECLIKECLIPVGNSMSPFIIKEIQEEIDDLTEEEVKKCLTVYVGCNPEEKVCNFVPFEKDNLYVKSLISESFTRFMISTKNQFLIKFKKEPSEEIISSLRDMFQGKLGNEKTDEFKVIGLKAVIDATPFVPFFKANPNTLEAINIVKMSESALELLKLNEKSLKRIYLHRMNEEGKFGEEIPETLWPSVRVEFSLSSTQLIKLEEPQTEKILENPIISTGIAKKLESEFVPLPLPGLKNLLPSVERVGKNSALIMRETTVKYVVINTIHIIFNSLRTKLRSFSGFFQSISEKQLFIWSSKMFLRLQLDEIDALAPFVEKVKELKGCLFIGRAEAFKQFSEMYPELLDSLSVIDLVSSYDLGLLLELGSKVEEKKLYYRINVKNEKDMEIALKITGIQLKFANVTTEENVRAVLKTIEERKDAKMIVMIAEEHVDFLIGNLKNLPDLKKVTVNSPAFTWRQLKLVKQIEGKTFHFNFVNS